MARPPYCAACGETMNAYEDRAEGARGIIHAGCYDERLDDPDVPPLLTDRLEHEAASLEGPR